MKNNCFICLLSVVLFLFNGLSLAAQDLNQLINDCKSLEVDQPQQALDLAEAQLTRISKQDDSLFYAEFLGCAALAAVRLNQSNLAQTYASDLEILVRGLADSEAKVNLFRRVGVAFHRLGNRVAAIDNYQMAMNVAESLELINLQIPILVNFGVLNSEIRRKEQAIENYQLALDLMEQQGDFKYQAPVLFNLALTLSVQERYDESLSVFKQVESMITSQWPEHRQAHVYAGITTIYLNLKNYEMAYKYNQKALKIFSQEQEKSMLYYSSQISNARILVARNQPQEALVVADEVWQYFQEQDNRDQLISVTNPLYALSAVYEAVDKPLKALSVLKLAIEINVDFQNTFNKETMAQMQARLSDSNQHKQLAELRAQQAKNQVELNAVQHNRQLILLLVSFGSIFVVAFFYWQRQTNKRLHTMSIRDALTNLGNRRAVAEWLAIRSLPDPPNVRLLWLFDLDFFKEINDKYGHEAGDQLLRTLANNLTKINNSERMIARWGGEEFVIITDDITAAEIESFRDNLMDVISRSEVNYKNNKISVTASMGVCEVQGSDEKTWRKALIAVDKALYQAKNRGRNCVVFSQEK